MNINLGSLFINNEGTNMMQQIQQADNGQIKEALLNGKIADIKSLLPGMLFEGDVADINNLQVKIILDNNSVLNASMKEAVNLNIGDHVIFQVKENSDSKIVIKPFQSDEGSAVITKALNISGITINEKNVAVVKELMSQGQPLDKNTIMDTVRLFNRFPEAELSDIIELKKHDIPVTPDNITMYKAFSEGSANISANLGNIAEDVPKVIENILSGSDNSQSIDVVSDILDIIISDKSSDVMNSYENTFTVNESENNMPAQVMEDIKSGQEFKENLQFQAVPDENSKIQSVENFQKDLKTLDIKVSEQQYSDNKNEVISEDGKVIKLFTNKEQPEIQQSDRIFASLEKQVQNIYKYQNSNEKNVKIPLDTVIKGSMEIDNEASAQIPITKEDKLSPAYKLFENMTEKIDNDKNVDMKSIKQEIVKVFEEAEPKQIKIMAESEPFKKLIQTAIKKNMFVKPDIIRESDNPKEEIVKLYEKVKEQLEKLSESVKDAAAKGMLNDKQSSPILNNIKTANQNLNFMNELNNMASYMQIPVKFTGQEAAGELYVFNRNVKKTVEEGISAFLHFDLDNLGVTDIRINLKEKGLRIGFELDDEVSVKLVDKHIDELLNRLKEKGYSVNCSVEQKDKTEHNSLERIFEQDKKQVSIKRYTLDIRT